MLRDVRRHRHHAGNGCRQGFPQFQRRLDLDVGGFVVCMLGYAVLRGVVLHATECFEDDVARSRRLSAVLLMQTLISMIIAPIILSGLIFSKVPKSWNAMGTVATLAQVILFGALFIGGNWIASEYINFAGLNRHAILTGQKG